MIMGEMPLFAEGGNERFRSSRKKKRKKAGEKKSDKKEAFEKKGSGAPKRKEQLSGWKRTIGDFSSVKLPRPVGGELIIRNQSNKGGEQRFVWSQEDCCGEKGLFFLEEGRKSWPRKITDVF